MTREEVDDVIRREYSDYPSLIPPCALSEEDAIALIRQSEKEKHVPVHLKVQDIYILSPLEEGSVCVNAGTCLYSLYPVLEASALAELCERPEFITKVTMDYFVTTSDKEGLCYAIMAHTLFLKGGYPHDPHQEHWDRDSLYLAEDTCPLIWEKAELEE